MVLFCVMLSCLIGISPLARSNKNLFTHPSITGEQLQDKWHRLTCWPPELLFTSFCFPAYMLNYNPVLFIASPFFVWSRASHMTINPFSTRPHRNAFWYNHSWLGFLKILNYVSKERENLMAHRNYFRRNNLWILKLATYTKIEDHYSRCKLATF